MKRRLKFNRNKSKKAWIKTGLGSSPIKKMLAHFV